MIIKLATQCKECVKLKDALIWMTGSKDFGSSGIARKGFLKVVLPLLEKKANHIHLNNICPKCKILRQCKCMGLKNEPITHNVCETGWGCNKK
jgi:hypothetical protein